MDGQISDRGSSSDELDVRSVPKAQRHPQIFARFASLEPGASFVLINSHDPKHLHEEFERDHPGAYDWSYLESGPVWRIRITRLAASDLPGRSQRSIAADGGGMAYLAVDPGRPGLSIEAATSIRPVRETETGPA